MTPFTRLSAWARAFATVLLAFACSHARAALGDAAIVSAAASPGDFPLVDARAAAPLVVDAQDYAGVVRAVHDLQSDINRVAGVTPEIASEIGQKHQAVIVGTIGRSKLVDALIQTGKLNVKPVRGQWESWLIETVDQPMAGLDRALVLAGSDKRGTIYGIYELSQQIGVSPWYWWADVAAEHHDSLFVRAGRHVTGSPSVKYRGIFLNDEAPDLTNWVRAKFGTVTKEANPHVIDGVANYGHEFYSRLFELLLRLRANYLWPAMWNNAFNEDDPDNARLADDYGIVMGTSHQEPMLRAQKEWDWRYLKTIGPWNYAAHPEVLEEFWREGIRRNKAYESLVTIGLRGANDTEMAPGGPDANRALLERIVEVQRNILRQEYGRPIGKIPQVWCLYKEVQQFYEHGMRVPDDVTLLWAEDNWGNVRRLPTAAERTRPGGAGVYYHFDYHGGPRSYQWLNSNPLPKIWDQLSLAKQYGADRVWIVNVGHLKGYEFPLEYYLSLAWDANRWTASNFDEFGRAWATREFGPAHAAEIADIMARYAKYNGRRKPELLAPDTYSLTDYREAETVVADFEGLAAKADEIAATLPAAKRDAFYELVQFPTQASALLNRIYLAAGRNALYAKQGRASAREQAVETHRLFEEFTAMMNHFNGDFANGKWAHFMDQPVLGYTTWRDPPENSLLHLTLVEPAVPQVAAPQTAMGVAIEGSAEAIGKDATLPQFDSLNRQHSYIEVFNRARQPIRFTAKASAPWIVLDAEGGTLGPDKRIGITIDWSQAPEGEAAGSIVVSGVGREVVIHVDAVTAADVTRDTLQGFAEGQGVVAIEPEHYTKRTEAGARHWLKIDDYGRTLSGMRAEAPVDAPSATPGKDSPCLEYRMFLRHSGQVEVTAITAPTLNFVPDRGLRYAVSFDDLPPQVVTLVPQGYEAQNGNRNWEKSVADNAHYGRSRHTLVALGYHTLKVWMVDPAVVLQKLIVDCGGLKPGYLGPPESFRGPAQYSFFSQDPEAVAHRRRISEASNEDHRALLQRLGVAVPANLPVQEQDPNRPAGTTRVPGNPYNWTDGVDGHTIVRSTWGNWNNYDEAKADLGPLPEALKLGNGQPVTDAATWWKQRQPELAAIFASEIYGKIPNDTPKITWEIVDVDSHALGGTAHMKHVIGHIDNSRFPLAKPYLDFTLFTPANANGPVPMMVALTYQGFPNRPADGPGPLQQCLARGWGYAMFVPTTVQADNGAGLKDGIIGLMNRGQPRRPDDWGAIAAWSWGLSRMIDYLETDPAVDAKRLGVEGHSRYGKAVAYAAAAEPRWAIAFTSCAGECGTKLYRHNVGQLLDNVAGPGEYHWMAGNFVKYAGHTTDLPVDQHELLALVAPRPIFVTGGTTDLWSDPIGEFKACVAASPVYELLGRKGVGQTAVPAPDAELISGDIGYRLHAGGHTDLLDWPTFLKFAERYFSKG
ncbi:MAG TPA: glycosyl hydrolase 115 family protein [Lacunisphaera sp.]|nr:glycosyl hydrolase 115 family protein [Lacunisphaera sp.]